MQQLQPVKGTRDVLFDEYSVFKYIADLSAELGALYGYKALSLPIFEYTEVFLRSLGEASDIVHKEMYTFHDRKDRSITLRPEFTASMVRCILSNNLHHTSLPLKLFTTGPLFRYERPQKLRYRQFHQINFENIGEYSSAVDAELISLADTILKRLNVGDIELNINTLGDEESRKLYSHALVSYLVKYNNDLSSDSQMRLIKNPLRILDSKDEGDRKIIQDAPSIQEFLTPKSQAFFESLLSNLETLGIKFKVNELLVRGLDYYTDTVFEFISDALGGKGTVLAGGRYDGLIEHMGGPSIPAVGFGAGIERLMELTKPNLSQNKSVVIILLDLKFEIYALKLANEIREANIIVIINRSQNIFKAMKNASESNARFAIFIGEEEMRNETLKIKDMDLRSEDTLTREQLITKLKSL